MQFCDRIKDENYILKYGATKMSEKMKNQWIQRLDIPAKLFDILNDNDIKTLGQLSKMSKKDLTNLGISQNETRQIETEMELCGLSLKGSL